jgi:curli biogenesis system outer membrane secretion channel CsgG
MHNNSRPYLILILLAAGFAGISRADSPKVAVISDTDEKDLAALITTELSSTPNLQLVERDDLAKIGDEAKLQQLAGQDAVALGKLVGADGLLFIARQNGTAEVRLTSVSLGYALIDEQIPAGANLETEAKSITHRVAAYAGKLNLLPAQVIPISVLNLRANFPTAGATELERHLTLLLESRLASEPRYVVLERRHAWSLGFERSLSSTPGPLIPGSYVVDGTIDLLSTGGSDLTVHLRQRGPGGKETDATISGSLHDLPTLVEKLVTEIGKTTGAGASSAAWQPAQEAREYLLEGVWGWQHHANIEALEALDSAELLGEKTQQLYTVRIAVLCALVQEKLRIENGQTILPNTPNPASADDMTALMLRAIDELILWHQPGPVIDTATPELRAAVRGWIDPPNTVVTLASNLIVLLDRDSPADADKVRLELRKYTQYDPLHGSLGNSWGSYSMSLREQQENDWCLNLDEELAAYRLDLSNPGNWMPASFLQGSKDFCHRFLTTPEQQAAGFDQFVESLKDIPGARFNYLMIRSSSPDPATADAAYRDYLSELWNHRDELAAGRGYDARWGMARDLPPAVLKRNAAAGLPLLRYVLQHHPDFVNNDPFLVLLWHPETWSEADAPGVWKDFQDYKQRVTQEWKSHDRNVEILPGELEPYETVFLARFPNLAAAPATPDTTGSSLVATRFWYPWRANSWPQKWFNYGIMDQDAQGLWLVGFHDVEHPSLFHVSLADFSTQIMPIPDNHYPQQLKTAPGALFLTWETHGHDGSALIAHQIARYDLATSQWTMHDLPAYSDCEVYPVGNTLYFFMRTFSMPGSEGAIAHYDWDSDKLTVLSSTRRRPAQNQFDDRQMLNQVQIFAGPGGRPCAATDDGVVYLQDTPGTWPFVFDCSFWDHAIMSNGLTLVQNQYGEATLVDPKASDVEHLMAAYTPFVRKRPAPGQQAARIPTPWAAQTLWDAPAEHTWYNKMVYGSGRLFILNPPAQKGGVYDMLVYTRNGGRAPRHVPLEFRLSDTDRPALSTKLPNAPALWQAGWIEHPDTTSYPSGDVQFFATAQGLVIQPANVGFWFIPYNDIDAWLKLHPAAAPH